MEIFPSLPLPSQCCVFISFSPSIRYISPFLPFCYSFSPPPTTLSCSSVSSTMLFLSIRFTFFFTFPYFIIFLLDMLESSLSLPYSLHLFHSYIYIPLLFLDFSSVHPLSLPLLSNLCFTSFSPLSYHLYHSVSVPQSSSLTFSSTSLLLLVSPSLCPSHYHSHGKGFTSYYIIIRTSFTIDRLCCGLRESTLFIHEVEKKSTFRKSIFTIFFYQYFFLYFI